MTKKEILSLAASFLIGVILTLLFCSNFGGARYVPYGSNGNQILDTRNGRMYNISEFRGGKKWLLTVHKVGVE